MRRLFTILLATLCAATALAAAEPAVEANTASEAALDGVRGIGPGLSGRILEERSRAPFQGWPDFIRRVGGVGPASAARVSRQGLTVNGQPYAAAPAANAPAAPNPPPAGGADRD